MHMHWESIHTLRGVLPPETIIGYEYRSEEHGFYAFVCAYHEDPDYFEDWTPVTVRDTHTGYYQCDRMGCEVGYWQEPMEKKEG